MMIEYQTDYKLGHFNLVGQQKPDYLLDAIHYEDAAWQIYEDYADRMARGENIDRIILNCMRSAAEHASAHTHIMYRRWCAEFNSKPKSGE